MIIFVRNGRYRILKGFKIQNRNIILVNINVLKHFSNACYQPFITLRTKMCSYKNVSYLHTSQDKIQIHNENDNLKSDTQITISRVEYFAFKNNKRNLQFDSTQTTNFVKLQMTHQLLAQIISLLEELVNIHNQRNTFECWQNVSQLIMFLQLK